MAPDVEREDMRKEDKENERIICATLARRQECGEESCCDKKNIYWRWKERESRKKLSSEKNN